MKLPSLPLEEWEETKITLHLYLQIIGKIKLALAIRKNHWWHITLLPHPLGLTTGWVPSGDNSLQIVVDMVNHQVKLDFSNGKQEKIGLREGLTVAAFYKELMEKLERNQVQVTIQAVPYDHPCKEPFADCLTYHSYDREYIERFHQVLQFVTRAFEKFRGRYLGKVSPVQLYWHHMDLAVTRFNGNKAPAPSADATPADRDAYSHEVISAGFWAGDENVRGAAFYSYTFPSPANLEESPLKPDSAYWEMSSGSPMAMLMYDDLRKHDSPENALLEFLESSYQAGASRGDWPQKELIYSVP